MSEDDPFLRSIYAAPTDRLVRLVYADWLDERNDPRAELLRLEVRATELTPTQREVAGVCQRLVELRATLPSDWLARLGSYRSVKGEPAPAASRLDDAAAALGREVKFTDAEGYEHEITAAVICGQTGAVAYVEERSQWRGQFQDIRYHLRVRGSGGETVEWEVETYNPYFGCGVRFLEWFGDRVVFIYREKHDTYICKFGLRSPAVYRTISDYWVLDGHHIGYQDYRDKKVCRLSVPELEELPPLTERQAAKWQLLPTKSW